MSARKQPFGEYQADTVNSYTVSPVRFLKEGGLYAMISLVCEWLKEKKDMMKKRQHIFTLD